MIQKCTTRLNHAPEATGFPTEAIEVMENDRKSFSFNVADPDGHNWDIKATGETKGVFLHGEGQYCDRQPRSCA